MLQNLTFFAMNHFSPGGTLVFSYIRRLGPFLGIQNVEFQYSGVFRKTNIFGGMKILWILFWGHYKIGLI